MYGTTSSLNYLQKGKKLLDDMLDLFWDEQYGGFFQTGIDAEQLLSREKEIYDDALPSGNGLAAVMLVKMAFLTGETSYLDKVEEMKYSFYDSLSNYASASTSFMQSLMLMENPTKEVVVIGQENDIDRQKLIKKLHSTHLPHTAVLVGENSGTLSAIAPFTAEYKQLEGKTTIYVCENFACQNPTTDVEVAMRKIVGE